jgi:tRNA-specific 2-thiouridylase
MTDFSSPHTPLPIPPGATIAVAMSGGVDSSVAAALCVAGGYRVFGIMLRLWSEPGATAANKCCTLAAMDDARAVAGVLDIPFQVLDVEAIFKRVVVDAFAQAAERGDTPNPCFTCNRRMRFGYLLDQARALGADYLATGHYARVARGPDGAFRLLRGLDPSKDQAYVLHRLDQDQLAHALFPIGGYPKTEVRALAERFGLPVASRPDSVDLCWTGPDGVPGFLSRNLPAGAAQPGPIVDLAGRELGRHRGLPYYTDGQRHGLGIAAGHPVYVVRRDAAANALIVGPAAALLARRVLVDDMHWVSGTAPDGPIRVEAQIRYRAPGVAGTLIAGAGDRAALEFDAPVRAPTVGQGLVAYAGETVLGGGRIAGSG